eukprot:TRINITY_DN19791_c0_g2_i1.p1 TRINITY_DN19791_c0_g2~~TRINITY_DN19791_c0_g2_i1.p1  ORF type:complete len:330 (+),score=66.40 TRINITY_DN19791_c0_g2_i1:199-1188(+)
MGNALESYKCLGECETAEKNPQLIAVEFEQSEMVVNASPCIDSQMSVWDTVNSEGAAQRDQHARSRQLVAAACQDNAPFILELFAEGGVHMTEMHKALFLACGRGSCNVVRELVAIGLDVNCPGDASGMSPLHLAACRGHVGICEVLLDALADANCQIKGLSALDLARKLGQDGTAEALGKHLASSRNPDGDSANMRAIVLPRVSALLTKVVQKSDFADENSSIAKNESKSTMESDDQYSYRADTELISNFTVTAEPQDRSPEDADAQYAQKPWSSREEADAQSEQSPSTAAPEAEAEAKSEAENGAEVEAEADEALQISVHSRGVEPL